MCIIEKGYFRYFLHKHIEQHVGLHLIHPWVKSGRSVSFCLHWMHTAPAAGDTILSGETTLDDTYHYWENNFDNDRRSMHYPLLLHCYLPKRKDYITQCVFLQFINYHS